MKTRIFGMVALFVLLIGTIPLHAQQNTTTATVTSAAVTTNTATVVTVSSATGISAGGYIYIDNELMLVRAVSSTTLTVGRAQGGRVSPHVSGAPVYFGLTKGGTFNPADGSTSGVFQTAVPYGPCTPGGQQYSTVIHVETGRGYSCVTDSWSLVAGGTATAFVEAVFHANLNTGMVDDSFFVANRPYQIVAIREVHGTAGGSGCVVEVTKDTSTNAPGAGTDLLTNTSSTGFDCAATANTVQVGTFTATTTALRLAVGDRLSVDFAGTLTSLVNLTITVTLKPL